MGNLNTRIASLDDLREVASLFDEYRQFYDNSPDLKMATTYIQDRIKRSESIIIVAENADQIIGFCQLYPTFCSVLAAPVFTLYDLYVSPKFRKLGVGRTLLLASERHAEQNGIKRLDLTTAKTNYPAQSLYESLGWVRDEVFYSYSKSISQSNSV